MAFGFPFYSPYNMMHKHEEKYCPRCGSKFECKVGDVLNCQCTKITISDDARNFFAENVLQ